MKKNTMFSLLLLMFGYSAGAQKLDASKIPAPVKASFAKNYPGTTAKWEKEDGEFEAGFKQNGKAMSALFKPDGTMTESEVAIKLSELPAPVVEYVKAHYKGAVIKESAKITKADGTINYEAEVNKMDVVFDANGKFIKEAKD